MKVLYVTSEALPFAASGGLADVAGSLPRALRTRLIGCRVVLPLYESVPQELREGMTFLGSLSVPVAWRRQYCGVFEAKHNGVIYYLLDNQYYFKRAGLYGHYDDAERFAFLARAALETRPAVRGGECVGCGRCAEVCPARAIEMSRKLPHIDRAKCIRCFCCQEMCPKGAMKAKRPLAARILERR